MASSIHVLLTDDEELYVEYLAKVLRRRGMKVDTAPDGSRALSLLAREEYDVIVLDLRMPGRDGRAALEAIRERDGLTPVILLTGQMDLDRVTLALKAGAAEVLLKPCPVETLVSAIENANERKAAAKEVAEREAK